MVKWHYQDDDGEEDVRVAARLLLFGHLSNNENSSITPKIVAVIHSLTEYHLPQHKILY
jgi:hypothetical protein